LLANKGVSLDVSDIWAGGEVFGMFYKRYIRFGPFK